MDDSQFLAAFREFPDRIRVIEWKDGRNHMRLDCHDQGPWYFIGQRMPKIRRSHLFKAHNRTGHEAACIVERALRDKLKKDQCVHEESVEHSHAWFSFPKGYRTEIARDGDERAALIAAVKAVLKEGKDG